MKSSTVEARAQLIARATELLSKKPYTKEDSSLFDSYMKLADAMNDGPTPKQEDRAKSQSEELRKYILSETRTYSPLTTSTTGQFIPTEFEKQLILTAMSAGPLFAGSPVCSEVQTPTGGPRKMPTSNDVANVGYVQTEAGAPTEAEITLGQTSMAATTFSSGIALLSNELLQDADWILTGEKVLSKTLGMRLGRIQNQTFLASLLTQLAANSSAFVTPAVSGVISYTDIVNLVSAVNAQYRYSDRAGFLMNSSTQKELASLVDADGRPILHHILDQKPTLIGYPVFVSDYADNIAASGSGKSPVLFGDWSYVFIRHIPGIDLQVMRQRFAEYGQTAFIARKRADMQYSIPSTADSAIKVLHS